MELLKVENLRKYYPLRKGIFSRRVRYIKAVDGVSFEIRQGETMGLVGESGCGKTTIAKVLVKLEKPTGGRIIYKGKDVTNLSKREEKSFRTEVQMIFQDPHASLDPRMKVGDSVEEALKIHGLGNGNERREKVIELFSAVGLEPEHVDRYPHELSGGQKQRIGIARALALNPKLLIADEPVSALDISIQAQVLNLLIELKKKYGLSYLFIAHNLSVIRHVSDKVAIMYKGRMMEMARTEDIFERPLHPYTKILLYAQICNRIRTYSEESCVFYAKCPKASSICIKRPEIREVEKGHFAACWNV
jgi:oligopeptide/dipeptide ABC transporter ATP-binding protein